MKRMHLLVPLLVAACSSSAAPPTSSADAPTAPIFDAGDEAPDAELAHYKIFDPADYPGYDPTGATDSAPAFQAAVDAASKWVADGGAELFDPPPMTRSDGTVVGPDAPQAIVRTRGHAIFKLGGVFLKSNVRVEIDASATLISGDTHGGFLFHAAIPPGPGGGNTAQQYIDNVTVTSFGSSTTFTDTGRRCAAAGMPSPCQLPKAVKYSGMTFPDGSDLATGDTALARRFVVDFDYRRFPDTSPPQQTGDGPRGSGVKLRQVKHFLVEHMLELAYPGIVLHPGDTPSGPGGIGSNTYPSTAGNGFSIEPALPPSGESPDMTEGAVQPRNGTVRFMHCENCTRGYGILEIHAGVDIDIHHISTRGGVAVRWESRGQGQSTRQHAWQVVAYDCNAAVLMSAHDNNQVHLEASDVKAIGCDDGFRSETTGGDTKQSSITRLDVYSSDASDPGDHAQVILCRFAACDSKYGSVAYDDDAWNFRSPEYAIQNDNARATSSISISNVRCSPASTFAHANVGYGACSGL